MGRYVVITCEARDGSGGLELAAGRLAQVLEESENRIELWTGDAGTSMAFGASRMSPGLRIDASIHEARELSKQLVRAAPDLVIAVSPPSHALQAIAASAPVILYAQEHSAVCPDGTKYWARRDRACEITAGRACIALRPILGCGPPGEALRLRQYRRFVSMERLLVDGRIPIWTPCRAMGAYFGELGIPGDRIGTVPNLGIRLSEKELEEAATRVPAADRDVVIYLGRMTRAKGAHLLPALGELLGADDRLRAFGDGYLRARLGSQLGRRLQMPVSQYEVAGLLMWARAVVFPSMWPEPGGIVGIDSQMFGVPLAAFSLGAPLDWSATLFTPGDIRSVSAWAREREPVKESRSSVEVSRRQRQYWKSVGMHAERLMGEWLTAKSWSDPHPDVQSWFESRTC